jgi:hypothetical protein
MTPDRHREKAERITRSLAKCTPADHEAVIEGAMLAGSHWLNLALHGFGLRPPDRDVMHAEFLTRAERMMVSVVAREMVEALEEIEAMRALYVRGDAPGGEAAARRALERLELIGAAARAARPLRATAP